MKYEVISLFSGCGGLDLGFKGGFQCLGKQYPKRKFHITWANDIDAKACITFRKHFDHPIVCGDIAEILHGKHPALSPAMPAHADVVLGGFPCQDFSVAGKRSGFQGKRGQLYKSMVETVRRVRPAIFVAENVKGLLSMVGAMEQIKSDFGQLGYHVTHQLCHAANFGVPQNRERVIIIGTDKKRALPPFEFMAPTHTKAAWVTLAQAIGDLEEVEEGGAPNHYWSKAKKLEGKQGNTTVSKSKIAPTMRAEHHGNIEFHWNGTRRLSAREAARIQTFPDNFIFYPSTSSAYRQIGNAVPPLLAWHLAQALEKLLDQHLTP